MKRIFLLIILIFTAGIMSSCNNSGSGDATTGYVDPVFTTAKTQGLKSYNIAGFSCTTSKSCGAVIFTGNLNGTDYTGFAVDNYLTGGSKFSLKIYWNAGSISSISTASYTLKLVAGGNTYTTTSGILDVTITSGVDANSVTVYTIKFNSPITIVSSAYTISNTDTIVAYKYPE